MNELDRRMSQQPPFRQRPNLHLALTQLTGSPRHAKQTTPSSTPSSTPIPTPSGTPFAKTAYSPFRSAGLKPPTPYAGDPGFSFGRAEKPNSSSYRLLRIRRTLSSRPIWLLLMVVALTLWWFNGGSSELDIVKLSATGLGNEFFQERRMQDYQFYPATNPKIHVR